MFNTTTVITAATNTNVTDTVTAGNVNSPLFHEACANTLIAFLELCELANMACLGEAALKVYNPRDAFGCGFSGRDPTFLCQTCSIAPPRLIYGANTCNLANHSKLRQLCGQQAEIADMFFRFVKLELPVTDPPLVQLRRVGRLIRDSVMHLTAPVHVADPCIIQRMYFLVCSGILYLPGVKCSYLRCSHFRCPYLSFRNDSTGYVYGVIMPAHAAAEALGVMTSQYPPPPSSVSAYKDDVISMAMSFREPNEFSREANADVNDPCETVYIPAQDIWKPEKHFAKVQRLFTGDYTTVKYCVWCERNIRHRSSPSLVPHCSQNRDCRKKSIEFLGFDPKAVASACGASGDGAGLRASAKRKRD